MITKLLTIVATTALLSVAGLACSKDDSTEQKTPAAEQEYGHAKADVVPGSHEDWCGEHGVAESQCTRCNPALTAAFKATGDWCDEHGVPESQCHKCNPDLEIVRPAPPARKE